jgi:hypothetical protein
MFHLRFDTDALEIVQCAPGQYAVHLAIESACEHAQEVAAATGTPVLVVSEDPDGRIRPRARRSPSTFPGEQPMRRPGQTSLL